jgi:hypothetical protein
MNRWFFCRRTCKAILLLAVSLATGAACAHEPMHMAMGEEPALGASATFASDGRLWVVSAHDGHVLLRHSDDFGKTLSAPTMVNAVAEPVSTEGENRPKIALGRHGEIYVSWTRPLPAPYTGFIRFARSLDGGAHFAAPLTVHHDRAAITHRFDALAVDARGDVLVAWIDKRDVVRATTAGKSYPGAALYYAWSDDRGASFHVERKLADHSCECCRIALAALPDGGIAAFFRAVYGDNIRDHAFAALHAGDPAPTAVRATYTQWHIEGCPHQGPGLAVAADGTRHAVWFSARDDAPTIWYGQLDPGHAPKHLLAVATAGAAHADVAVAGARVWIAWNQFAATGTQLMLRESSDGGAHFGAAQVVARTGAAAGSPQLLVWKQQAYVAWNTASGFRLLAAPAFAAPPQGLTAADVPALLRPPTHGVRIIALWALDCAYCEANLHALATLHAQHPEVEVVTVATDDVARRNALEKRLRAAGAVDLPARAYADATPGRLDYLIDPHWGGETPRTLVIRADGSRAGISGELTPQRLRHLWH